MSLAEKILLFHVEPSYSLVWVITLFMVLEFTNHLSFLQFMVVLPGMVILNIACNKLTKILRDNPLTKKEENEHESS